MRLIEFLKKIWKETGVDQVRETELPDFETGELKRKKVIFSGTVQHVGFRYETYIIAQKAGITGWVKNRPDGKVEAEFQGEESRIRYVRQYLESLRRICVDQAVEIEIEVVEGEQSFQITG